MNDIINLMHERGKQIMNLKRLMKLVVEKESITDRILSENGFKENDVKYF